MAAKITNYLSQKSLSSCLGSTGYINQFFTEYLFSGFIGNFLSPWSFLTTLSAFELISGLLLISGFFIRTLSVIWALLLWSFVVSLPVVTTPGIIPTESTYTSPALFVQIRDIALSGLFFLLYNLGSGKYSLDAALGTGKTLQKNAQQTSWNEMGLLLRVSLALPFLIAGLFNGLDHIQTFKLPAILSCLLGTSILAGVQTRIIGSMIVAAMVYFILQKVSLDKSLIANLNGFKREFGLIAGGLLLIHAGGGSYYVPKLSKLLRSKSSTASA